MTELVLAPYSIEAAIDKGDPVVLPIVVNGEEVLRVRVNMDVGVFPLLEFASAAEEGIDSNSLRGLAAQYSLIEDCIATEDWDKFKAVMKTYKFKGDDILQITTRVWSAVANRPLDQPSSSSNSQSNLNGGRTSDSPASEPSSLSTDVASKKPATVVRRRTAPRKRAPAAKAG
jgi:hypothetical protein